MKISIEEFEKLNNIIVKKQKMVNREVLLSEAKKKIDSILFLLRTDQKIQAIKTYRNLFDTGLRDAKESVIG